MNKKNRELLGGLTGGGVVGRGEGMHLALNDLQRQQGLEDGTLGGNRRQKLKRAFEASGGGSAKGMTNRQMLEAMSVSGGPAPIVGNPPPTASNPMPAPANPEVGSQMWGNYGEGPSLLAKYSDLSGGGVVGGPAPISGGGGGLIQRPTVGGVGEVVNPVAPNPAANSPIAQAPVGAGRPTQPGQTVGGVGLGGVVGNKPQAVAPRAQVSQNPSGAGMMQKVR